MKRSRARLALLLLPAVSLVGAIAPTQASAFTSWYNCVNKAPHSWCDGRANGSYDGEHSWDYNQGSNPGGGSFYVCQRVWDPDTGGVLVGSGCAINWTSNYYGNVQCACYDAEVLHTNGSATSVNGFADAAW